MRKALILIGLLTFLLMAMPAFATEATDYIDEEVAEWTQIAEDNGFNILETFIETVEGHYYYEMTLAPGIYHFYSSGGLHITDLDLFINDTDGYAINSDTEVDKIPIVVVMIEEETTVQVDVQAWSYEDGYEQGYFCLLVTCEDDGEIIDYEEDITPAVPEYY